MTLRTRITIAVTLVVGLAVGVVAFAAYQSTRSETMGEIDRFLRTRAPLAGLIEGGGGRGQGSGRGDGPQSVIGDDVVAQVIFADGTTWLLGQGEIELPVSPVDMAVALGRAPDELRSVAIDGVDYRLYTRPAGAGVAIQVARDLTETEAILEGLRNRLILVGVAGALLAGLAGWLLAGRAVRPVRDLTGAAEHVAATGTLDAAIPVDRSDEIGRLANAFNEMLARLDASRVAQQQLVADASHELRTPLTSLRTNIELLAAGKVPAAERADLLADLKTEIVELGALVSELVDLATVGRAEEERSPTDLSSLVADAVGRAARRASQTFEASLTPVQGEVRLGAVTRAVTNLLDNAVKWSPADGVITVTLDESALSVADRGPGIPFDDLPFVFQRFYRAASARAMPGSGLGLAIVAAVAEDHGWKPFARNRDGGGAEVGWHFGG